MLRAAGYCIMSLSITRGTFLTIPILLCGIGYVNFCLLLLSWHLPFADFFFPQRNCCCIIAREWLVLSSECERCIALLEASVSVLLHCLETMDFDSMVINSCFSLEVDEGVKCAHCLRRIYEEVGIFY